MARSAEAVSSSSQRSWVSHVAGCGMNWPLSLHHWGQVFCCTTAAIIRSTKSLGARSLSQAFLAAPSPTLRGYTCQNRSKSCTSAGECARFSRDTSPSTAEGDRVFRDSGFRRSELAELRAEDLEFHADRLLVFLRRSKTDQQHQGAWRAIRRGRRALTCPVRALRAWLDGAGITEGPVFRALLPGGRLAARAISTQTIARLLARASAAAGIASVTPHSLRAGCVTVATSRGEPPLAVRRVTGHRTVQQLARYDRADIEAPPLDLGL